MELQFSKIEIPCLTHSVWETQTQEQTQEVRLTDAMPDIGSVIGAWGQTILRSKQWRTGTVGVSGGIMAWVLYAPEDGSEARCVEAWIPFQMSWEMPQSKRDGTIRASCLLKGVDARSVSARKLVVRAEVSVLAEALEPIRAEAYRADEIPEDVCVRRQDYPIGLAREAGEKAFALEEELSASDDVETILRYSLQPELIDKKVMADKVVFRGTACVHILYRNADGKLKSRDFEIPFSQYADLEKEYAQDADADVSLALTNLELEQIDGGRILVKCGIIGQYVVYDRENLCVVSDAYSIRRQTTPHFERVALPRFLDRRTERMRTDAQTPQCLDAAFFMESPAVQGIGDSARVCMRGTYQTLCEDEDGILHMEQIPWEQEAAIPCGEDCSVQCRIHMPARVSFGGGELSAEFELQMDTVADCGLDMMDALELGEETAPDPMRPSVILRRATQEGLWDLAKRCNTTTEAIQKANHLDGEPQPGQMLLIPVP